MTPIKGILNGEGGEKEKDAIHPVLLLLLGICFSPARKTPGTQQGPCAGKLDVTPIYSREVCFFFFLQGVGMVVKGVVCIYNITAWKIVGWNIFSVVSTTFVRCSLPVPGIQMGVKNHILLLFLFFVRLGAVLPMDALGMQPQHSTSWVLRICPPTRQALALPPSLWLLPMLALGWMEGKWRKKMLGNQWRSILSETVTTVVLGDIKIVPSFSLPFSPQNNYIFRFCFCFFHGPNHQNILRHCIFPSFLFSLPPAWQLKH